MSNTFSFGLPQKNHFAEYLFQERFFNETELALIKQAYENGQKEKSALNDGSEEGVESEAIRKSTVVYLPPVDPYLWIFTRLAQQAIACNNERYYFDILGFHEGLQIAQYGEGDFFDWHLDFGIGSTSTRKLSLSVQVSDSDEYEGGDLQFMVNNKIYTAPRTKGTVVIFPSFIMHRVTPITKGKRMSIVGWVTGPPYR